MARKKLTTVTFTVKLKVPVGSTTHDMEMFLHNVLLSKFHEEIPEAPKHEDDITITMLKKETTYGP